MLLFCRHYAVDHWREDLCEPFDVMRLRDAMRAICNCLSVVDRLSRRYMIRYDAMRCGS